MEITQITRKMSKIKACMQIRHSYSIGSVVPVSSAGTFHHQWGKKTKTAADARVSYRPAPPRTESLGGSVSAHSNQMCRVVRFQDGQQRFPRRPSPRPPQHPPPRDIHLFCFTHVCDYTAAVFRQLHRHQAHRPLQSFGRGATGCRLFCCCCCFFCAVFPGRGSWGGDFRGARGCFFLLLL